MFLLLGVNVLGGLEDIILIMFVIIYCMWFLIFDFKRVRVFDFVFKNIVIFILLLLRLLSFVL